jgi:hypothetical protein
VFFLGQVVPGRGRIVEHVGIVAAPASFQDGENVSLVDWPQCYVDHVGPAEPQGSGARQIELDTSNVVVGYVTPFEDGVSVDVLRLLAEARRILAQRVEGFDGSLFRKLYTPFPARQLDYRLPDTRFVFPFRGSCAGFVEHCFEIAGCDIVLDEPCQELPEWPTAELSLLFAIVMDGQGASHAASRTDARLAEFLQRRLGITHPYHFLLPGYQYQAFCRSDYRHRVASTSEAFV